MMHGRDCLEDRKSRTMDSKLESGKVSQETEPPPRKPESGAPGAWHRWVWSRVLELRGEIVSIAVLSVVLVVVVCLLSLPIVFYHIGPEESDDQPTSGSVAASTTCEPYSGQLCASTLKALQECSTPQDESDRDVLVFPRYGDQKATAEILGQLILALPLVGASDECKAAALPFTCQYFLPPCNVTEGSAADVILPSSQQCFNVLALCAKPLTFLIDLHPDAERLLPECSSLPNGTDNSTCKDAGKISDPVSPVERNITCKDDFTLVNGTCLARCDSWEQNAHSDVVAEQVTITFASTVGLTGGIAVVVVTILQRKTKLKFPSVLVVYHTLSVSALAILILMNFTDQDELFCSSEVTVVGVLDNIPLFCTISGLGTHYIVHNLTLWWFFHVCALFWKVMFPIHARNHQQKNGYIHIAVVIAGLTLPIPSIIAAFATGGYSITSFPPILCGLKDRTVEYYSLWLPMNLMLIAGIVMLIILTWSVHKHRFFSGKKQMRSIVKLSTAEKKLIFVFAYCIVFTIIALAYLSVATRDKDRLYDAVTEYFLCEAGGYNPENPCPRDYEQYTYPRLLSTVYAILGFIPLISLVFVIDTQWLKQGLRKAIPRLSSPTGETSETPPKSLSLQAH